MPRRFALYLPSEPIHPHRVVHLRRPIPQASQCPSFSVQNTHRRLSVVAAQPRLHGAVELTEVSVRVSHPETDHGYVRRRLKTRAHVHTADAPNRSESPLLGQKLCTGKRMLTAAETPRQCMYVWRRPGVPVPAAEGRLEP